MLKRIKFVGRKTELDTIQDLVNRFGETHILFIHGVGGIGKTRLLHESAQRFMGNNSQKGAELHSIPLLAPEAIDFDDNAFQIPENLERRISRLLSQSTGQDFNNYFEKLRDLRNMQQGGVSAELAEEQGIKVRQALAEGINAITDEIRVILRFDTTEKINDDVWNHLLNLIKYCKNVLFIFAGRNGVALNQSIGADLKSKIKLIELEPLTQTASEEYLNEKLAALHFSLDQTTRQKLLLLADGSPILVDLAVEWLARGIPLPWFKQQDLETLNKLPSNLLIERKNQFKEHLVLHIAKLGNLIDRLTLVLSHVYPVNAAMIASLLNIPEEGATTLFEEASEAAFVKVLADGRISLHDLMRDLVNLYVWPKITNNNEPRRFYSSVAIEFLRKQIKSLNKNRAVLEEMLDHAREIDDKIEALSLFSQLETVDRELWTVREKLVIHALVTDIDAGVKTFTEVFDLAVQSNRYFIQERLLKHVAVHQDELSQANIIDIESRRFEPLMYRGKYEEAETLVDEILSQSKILRPDLLIITFLQKGNVMVRRGQVKEAIPYFEQAVVLSQNNHNDRLLVRSRNGLGWAHRLAGNWDKAKTYYEENRRYFVQQKDRGDDYGWLLNNLAFLLSERDRQKAITLGETSLAHWRKLGNRLGIASAHSTLGITYYRSDISDKAEKQFNEALYIFSDLGHREWKGQTLSWRGALYQDMNLLDKAEADLKLSLEIGPAAIRAMTLNRLGRVYMSRKDWDTSETYIRQALEEAKAIPDYVYWLGSIARLVMIAAEKGEYYKLEEFEALLEEFYQQNQKAEENSEGMTYIGLARLSLNRGYFERAENYLQRGIQLVTEYGSYARADIRSRLSHYEKDFSNIDPTIIRSLGQRLHDLFLEKELIDERYSLARDVLNHWANWEG